MRKRISWIAGGTALLALAGCGSEGGGGTTTPESSDFQASVQGSVAGSYEGKGFFRITEAGAVPRGVQFPPGLTLPGSFVLFSADPEAATRTVQSFAIARLGAELPAVGTYALGTIPLRGGSGFFAAYGRASGGEWEHYAAVSGEVRVTASSAERVAGSFHFRGARVCTGNGTRVECIGPLGLHGGLVTTEPPTIEVSGTFAARRAPAAVTAPFGM